MAGGIFISYRRDGGRHAAGRLVDRLGRTFGCGQLFMDVEAIEPGLDFVQVLSERIDSCEVLLALIGPGWLEAADGSGRRRLDNPADFVRLEIEAALRRNIRVIPVLLDNAGLPNEDSLPGGLKPLARRQAVSIAHERFATDANALVRSLARVVAPNRAPAAGAPRAARSADTGGGHRVAAWTYAVLALPAMIVLAFLLSDPLMILFAAWGVEATNAAMRNASVGVRVASIAANLLPGLVVGAVGAWLRLSRGTAVTTSEQVLYWIGGTFALACNGIFAVAFLGRTANAGLTIGLLTAAAVAVAGLVLMIVDLRRRRRVRAVEA